MSRKRVTGMNEFLADVEKMKTLPKKEIKAVTVKAANVIINSARAKCPSASLKPEIGLITRNDSKFPNVSLVGIANGKAGNKTITYAALASIIEYGAAERAPRSTKKRSQDYRKVLIGGRWVTMSFSNPFNAIAPRPFFRPAVDESENRVKDIIKTGLKEAILKQSKTNKIIK